jgi:hypothetical protein
MSMVKSNYMRLAFGSVEVRDASTQMHCLIHSALHTAEIVRIHRTNIQIRFFQETTFPLGDA